MMIDSTLELPNVPAIIAMEFLSRLAASPIRYWRGDFLRWNSRHYEIVPKDEIDAGIAQFLNKAQTRDKNNDLKPFFVKTETVNEVRNAIKWHRGTMISETREANTAADGSSLAHLIPFRNGLLDVDTEALIPHSPDYLTFGCRPFDYDPTLPEPEEWLKFMRSLFPDADGSEGDNISNVEEVMGYFLTSTNWMQKIIFLLGPARGGKGTIVKVLKQMLGDEAVTGTSLVQIGRQFGMANLIGKTLCVLPDERTHHHMGTEVGMILLKMSGQDPQSIDRKRQSMWEGVLDCRPLILSNEIPVIPDGSGVLPTRFYPVVLEESFLGREDPELFDRLKLEIPAIINRCLKGLKRLRGRGQFIMTDTAKQALGRLRILAAPHIEFFEEYFVLDPEGVVDKEEAYERYKEVAEKKGNKVPSHQQFCNRFLGHFGKPVTAAKTAKKPRRQVFLGVRWRDFADDEDADDHDKHVAEELIRKANRRRNGLPVDDLYDPIVATTYRQG